ncbi:MAG: ABC transporter permease [Christensenellales bacterium]
MNVLNKLTKKNLLLNKKRTIVTIIGIMLSTALVCAVAGLVTSAQQTFVNLIKNTDGDYHISFSNVPQEQQKYITQNNAVDSYYVTKELGYSKFESIQNEDKPYIYVVSMNENAFEKGAYKLIEGRMAQNENEIVIPQHLIDNGRVKINVGDKITLNVGTRELMDGSKLNQKNPYLASSSKEYIYQETGKAGDSEDYEEQIVDGQTKEYTVVGIMKRPNTGLEPYSAPGYTAVTYSNEGGNIGNTDKKVSKTFNFYVTLKNPKEYENVMNQIKNTIETENESEIEVEANVDLLRFEGVLSESTLGVLYGIASVIIVIIVVSSVFVIRNSFSISVSEKTKQYGMLASVGATKKQIKRSVLLEGLYIGIIAIPLGILLGIVAIIILLWIVNLLIGDMMEGTEFVYNVPGMAILISVVISGITIFLSCLIPAIKASKIPPIEAIRGTDDIKIKTRKIKTSKLTKKLFGIGGVIASKNLKRNRKKYRTTVVSLVVSISIFIALSSFLTYGQMMTGSYYTDLNYNITVHGGNEALYEKIATWSGINSYSYSYQTSAEIDVNKYGTDFAKEELENKKQIYEEDFPEDVGKYEYNTLGLTIVMVNNDYFKSYVKSLGMNEKDYSNIAILGDDMIHYLGQGKSKVEHYFNVKAGDSMEVTMDDEQKQIKISKITTERPMGYESCYTEGGYLFVSEDYPVVTKDKSELNSGSLCIDAQKPSEIENKLTDLKKESEEFENIMVTNLAEYADQEKRIIILVSIFLYGFIAVITLIGVTNIFNTITTNMILRSKEFANLKSIGMTTKEFNKMIKLESIMYGAKSLLIGIPIGLFGSYEIFKSFTNSIDFGFIVPWQAIIISVVFVFIIVGLTMKYSLNKINKQNIIETIRQDNI